MTQPSDTSLGMGQQMQTAALTLKNRGIEWSIDRLLVADGMITAMGWCANAQGVPLDVSLVLSFHDGKEKCYTLDCQLERPDVRASKPNLSARCGFFLYTSMASNSPPERIAFVVQSPDQEPVKFFLPFIDQEANPAADKTKRSIFFHYLSRCLVHLHQGNYRLIIQRLRTSLPALIAPRTSEKGLAELLELLPGKALLIVDHALGGGANHYREAMIADAGRTNTVVLLWTFSPITLAFQLKIILPDGSRQAHKVDISAWELLVQCQNIDRLVFNNGVSYPRPERIPQMLARFIEAFPGKRKLILLVHDFFVVCPSHFLLDKRGIYCGIPDLQTCQNCLPGIQDGLTNLFQAKDIGLWRNLWGNTLKQASEIICFSENTKTLLTRAYPELSGQRVQVRPHQVDYLTGTYAYPGDHTPLHVAMVGAISAHKGSQQFVSLARAARDSKSQIKFFVIGTLHAADKPGNIVETGPYQREDLPALLRQHAIHMALVLSICPETFSYVTHELITLGVPVLAFDIGAQGEAVHRYTLGKTVALCEGTALLEVLNRFKSELDDLIPKPSISFVSE